MHGLQHSSTPGMRSCIPPHCPTPETLRTTHHSRTIRPTRRRLLGEMWPLRVPPPMPIGTQFQSRGKNGAISQFSDTCSHPLRRSAYVCDYSDGSNGALTGWLRWCMFALRSPQSAARLRVVASKSRCRKDFRGKIEHTPLVIWMMPMIRLHHDTSRMDSSFNWR